MKPIAEKPVEEMTNMEQWAAYFQYLTDQTKREKTEEIIDHEEGIAMAVKTMTGFTQNEIEYIRKMSLLKAELDYQDGMVTAKRKGRSEGLAEGRNEGRNEEKLEIARNLKRMGLSVSQISEGTGLSPETIAQL